MTREQLVEIIGRALEAQTNASSVAWNHIAIYPDGNAEIRGEFDLGRVADAVLSRLPNPLTGYKV